jgi:hypothetical protein
MDNPETLTNQAKTTTQETKKMSNADSTKIHWGGGLSLKRLVPAHVFRESITQLVEGGVY